MDTMKHSRLVFLFLLGTAIFNILDYFFTMEALRMGYEEWNPVIDSILHHPILPFIKLLLIPLSLAVIWKVRNRIGPRLVYYSGTVFSVYLLLMIYFGAFIF